MNKYSRSAKRTFFGIACTLTIIGVIFIVARRTQPKNNTLAVLPQQEGSAYLSFDSDQDGLKDWEETIYRTDPHNPDTDGDGTPDGEEVALLRDPSKPPPDAISSSASDTPQTDDLTQRFFLSGENLTQRFANQLALLLVKGQGSKTPIDPKQVAAEVTSFINKTTQPITILSKRDLTIAAAESPATIRAYLNEVARIVKTNFLDAEEKPLLLFASIIQRDNFEDQLPRFDPFITNADGAVDKLLTMPVPESWANEHLALLNNLVIIAQGLHTMRTSNRDILATAAFLNPYLAAQDSLRALLTDVEKRIQQEHISFAANDPMHQLIAIIPAP